MGVFVVLFFSPSVGYVLVNLRANSSELFMRGIEWLPLDKPSIRNGNSYTAERQNIQPLPIRAGKHNNLATTL